MEPQWAVAYLENLGYKKHQAAAIVGHGMWESGGNRTNQIITTALGDAGAAHGGWQWARERWHGPKGLMWFAMGRATSTTDPETQLNFIDFELKNTERRAGRLLAESTTVEEATEAMMLYLRPRGTTRDNPRAGHAFERRLELARKVFNDLHNPEGRHLIGSSQEV
jgi:hypothetical protein